MTGGSNDVVARLASPPRSQVKTWAAAVRGSRERQSSLVFGLWFAELGLILGALVPGLLIWQTAKPAHFGVTAFPTWWAALVVTSWSGLRLAWQISSGRPRLYHFSFWTFIYIFAGLAPLCQLRNAEFPTTVPGVDPASIATAEGMIILAIAGFEIGSAVTRRAPHRATIGTALRRVSVGRASVLAVVGIAFAVYYIHVIGLGVLFSTRDARSLVLAAKWPNPTLASLVSGMAYAPLLVAVHCLVNDRRAKRAAGEHPTGLALIVVCVVLLLVVINPMSSARYLFGTVWLSLLFLARTFVTPRRARLTMIGVLLALIVVFPYADRFRSATGGGDNYGGVTQNFVQNGDYDAFGQTANTVQYVDEFGLTDGRQLSGALLFFVPRQIWPSKANDTGSVIAAAKGYHFTNLSEPLWAELYIDGWWPLLVIGFVGLGAAAELGGIALARSGAGSVSAVAGGILSFYLIILLRGSLLQAMGNLVVIVLCLYASSTRNRSAA
jgi:hypothetical protein